MLRAFGCADGQVGVDARGLQLFQLSLNVLDRARSYRLAFGFGFFEDEVEEARDQALHRIGVPIVELAEHLTFAQSLLLHLRDGSLKYQGQGGEVLPSARLPLHFGNVALRGGNVRFWQHVDLT